MTLILVIIAVTCFVIMIQMGDLIAALEDIAASLEDKPEKKWDFDIKSKTIKNGEFVDEAEN